MLRVRRAGGCSGTSIGTPNSEGDFKLRGLRETFALGGCVDVDVDAVLGTMVDDGILPGPASKSNVTSMLNREGDGCSAATGTGTNAGLGGRFDGDNVVIMEDLMYLSFDEDARGVDLLALSIF